MEKSQQWQELAQAIESQVGEIVNQADSRELGELVIPWLTEVSIPNDRGQELLDTLMQGLARTESLNIDRAMRMAFLLGAAWQKACDESAE
jgi:hypothetical protein